MNIIYTQPSVDNVSYIKPSVGNVSYKNPLVGGVSYSQKLVGGVAYSQPSINNISVNGIIQAPLIFLSYLLIGGGGGSGSESNGGYGAGGGGGGQVTAGQISMIHGETLNFIIGLGGLGGTSPSKIKSLRRPSLDIVWLA